MGVGLGWRGGAWEGGKGFRVGGLRLALSGVGVAFRVAWSGLGLAWGVT